jgi:hypothetical protein
VIPLDRFDELAGGLNHPEGAAWNPVDGFVDAGGEGGELSITLEGDVAHVGSSGVSMLGIAIDGRGRVYACDARNRPDGLMRVPPDGVAQLAVDDHRATTFDAPTNIAWVGEGLDRAVVANVGDTFLSIGDVSVGVGCCTPRLRPRTPRSRRSLCRPAPAAPDGAMAPVRRSDRIDRRAAPGPEARRPDRRAGHGPGQPRCSRRRHLGRVPGSAQLHDPVAGCRAPRRHRCIPGGAAGMARAAHGAGIERLTGPARLRHDPVDQRACSAAPGRACRRRCAGPAVRRTSGGPRS